MNQAVNLFIVYKFVQALSTPFNETDAYKLGLIDAEGTRIKSASSKEEKDSLTYFDKLIFNLKRILSKAGLKSKTANLAAALLLLKEDSSSFNEAEFIENIINTSEIFENMKEPYTYILKEISGNVTGAAVAGTGDSGVTWVRKKRVSLPMGVPGERRVMGRYINGVSYLKRAARKAKK